jgi:uncharacterized membrane protein
LAPLFSNLRKDADMSIPLHPLVVHVVVVFLIVVPLLVLVSLVWRGLRNRLDWITPIAAVVGGISALVAGETGEDLERRFGHTALIQAHTQAGKVAEPVAVLFAFFTVLWWVTSTQAFDSLVETKLPILHKPAVKVVAAVLAGLSSAVVLVVVFIAGHSGATAVWTSQ